MKTLLRLLLKSQQQQNRSEPPQTEKGMTLIELLIGTVMAFLILTPMLAFVVDMLNTDRREQLKANTEQDIQAAVDFIAQDLSQAIYIYDNNFINQAAADGTPGIRAQLPNPVNGTPILVFWKRHQIRDAVSVVTTPAANRVLPINCDNTNLNPNNNPNACNDAYVRSLVAYYQIKETDPRSIWCQPSGNPCPTRIARYEIREGVRNPNSTNPNQPYYGIGEATQSQQVSQGFNANFDFAQPRLNVTQGGVFPPSDVLVNYVDHSQPIGIPIDPAECQTALGNPADITGVNPTRIPETTLKIANLDNTNSFYACVDTSRNLAKVTIRGNSLRRLQSDANYNPNNSAFFPTASVQVQGRGAKGQ